MRYGIVEEGLDVICVGCNKVLSEDGKIPTNYCSECGNPLTLEAIKNIVCNCHIFTSVI